MKTFLISIILVVVTFSTTIGQDKKGFIVDPDGYTNVRENANSQSNIVAKVVDGEIFRYKETDSPWCEIETYDGKRGFMHKSRIKEFKINKNFCINSSFNELFLFLKNGKIISVCGIPAPEIIDSKYYSGLVVYDALNEIKLLDFHEGDYQTFEFKDGDIIIKEYANIPMNKDLENKFVPYTINKIMFAGERLVMVENAPYYNYPKLSEQELKTKVSFLKTTKFNEQDNYKAINIALVLALNSKDFEPLFLKLNQELNLHFDGEYSEKYSEALIIYQINKNNR